MILFQLPQSTHVKYQDCTTRVLGNMFLIWWNKFCIYYLMVGTFKGSFELSIFNHALVFSGLIDVNMLCFKWYWDIESLNVAFTIVLYFQFSDYYSSLWSFLKFLNNHIIHIFHKQLEKLCECYNLSLYYVLFACNILLIITSHVSYHLCKMEVHNYE